MKHIIDCDTTPRIPYEGWTIESHAKMGKLEWNPKNIELYLSDKQENGYITGYNLQKELEGTPVLNACVMDYLLEHKELIPESWQGKFIYLWGTIFRDARGRLCVGCLCWGGRQWDWNYDGLDFDWRGNDPAASLASQFSDSRKLIPAKTLEPLELPKELVINGIIYIQK